MGERSDGEVKKALGCRSQRGHRGAVRGIENGIPVVMTMTGFQLVRPPNGVADSDTDA